MTKNQDINRICPTCKKILYYSCQHSKNNSERINAKCRGCATLEYAHRSSELKNLLIRNYQFYYWLGFILADGHIGNNRLVATLSQKDEDHLLKLANYLEVATFIPKKINRNHISLRVQNRIVFESICNDFDIQSNKTEHPPKTTVFDNLTDDELLCVLVGFIDGDGSIKKST